MLPSATERCKIPNRNSCGQDAKPPPPTLTPLSEKAIVILSSHLDTNTWELPCHATSRLSAWLWVSPSGVNGFDIELKSMEVRSSWRCDMAAEIKGNMIKRMLGTGVMENRHLCWNGPSVLWRLHMSFVMWCDMRKKGGCWCNGKQDTCAEMAPVCVAHAIWDVVWEWESRETCQNTCWQMWCVWWRSMPFQLGQEDGGGIQQKHTCAETGVMESKTPVMEWLPQCEGPTCISFQNGTFCMKPEVASHWLGSGGLVLVGEGGWGAFLKFSRICLSFLNTQIFALSAPFFSTCKICINHTRDEGRREMQEGVMNLNPAGFVSSLPKVDSTLTNDLQVCCDWRAGKKERPMTVGVPWFSRQQRTIDEKCSHLWLGTTGVRAAWWGKFLTLNRSPRHRPG